MCARRLPGAHGVLRGAPGRARRPCPRVLLSHAPPPTGPHGARFRPQPHQWSLLPALPGLGRIFTENVENWRFTDFGRGEQWAALSLAMHSELMHVKGSGCQAAGAPWPASRWARSGRTPSPSTSCAVPSPSPGLAASATPQDSDLTPCCPPAGVPLARRPPRHGAEPATHLLSPSCLQFTCSSQSKSGFRGRRPPTQGNWSLRAGPP